MQAKDLKEEKDPSGFPQILLEFAVSLERVFLPGSHTRHDSEVSPPKGFEDLVVLFLRLSQTFKSITDQKVVYRHASVMPPKTEKTPKSTAHQLMPNTNRGLDLHTPEAYATHSASGSFVDDDRSVEHTYPADGRATTKRTMLIQICGLTSMSVKAFPRAPPAELKHL